MCCLTRSLVDINKEQMQQVLDAPRLVGLGCNLPCGVWHTHAMMDFSWTDRTRQGDHNQGLYCKPPLLCTVPQQCRIRAVPRRGQHAMSMTGIFEVACGLVTWYACRAHHLVFRGDCDMRGRQV